MKCRDHTLLQAMTGIQERERRELRGKENVMTKSGQLGKAGWLNRKHTGLHRLTGE